MSEGNNEFRSLIPELDGEVMSLLRGDVLSLNYETERMQSNVDRLNLNLKRANKVAVSGEFSLVCMDAYKDSCAEHRESITPVEIPSNKRLTLGGVYAEYRILSEPERDEDGVSIGYKKVHAVIIEMGPVEGTDCESYYHGEIQGVKLYFD